MSHSGSDTANFVDFECLDWAENSEAIVGRAEFITEDEVRVLGTLSAIEYINVGGTPIDTKALHQLLRMRSLRTVWLDGCVHSSEMIELCQRIRPDVQFDVMACDDE
jgi:hypothetical protein